MGVEGTLRKGMETTLRVLREAKALLLTIIEVLKHDPLYTWTLSVFQISKMQQKNVHSAIDSGMANFYAFR